ncbi:DUF86 domain-containing protein [Halalkalibacter nanhaiisediminis]|uniref:Uncharacterized protein YutE (UPF0331/DUF86 family) n=1 Tax=Halalkalibacter nanhaiisediminis TaxID=688079 RepID=A0A562QTM2_9BACI|nr:DUF86 domain-containing protein [Halalkalibacter nanhaiisediminis]TWI60099.1 uncharacterized protein YutE (UPF0331/DUF86 family) [Halalkalibacter nanhaiisediminis]
MYFVNREKIEETLLYMETIQEHFDTMNEPIGMTERLALERMAYVVIESIIDVGNSMIDGFIMRDPGGYEDIIDILEDEKVINADHARSFKYVIGLRKQLVQEYTAVNHQELADTLKGNAQALKQFPIDVRRYLIEELGPVSAFLPNESKGNA